MRKISIENQPNRPKQKWDFTKKVFFFFLVNEPFFCRRRFAHWTMERAFYIGWLFRLNDDDDDVRINMNEVGRKGFLYVVIIFVGFDDVQKC